MRTNIEERYKLTVNMQETHEEIIDKLAYKFRDSLNAEFQECASKIAAILKEYDMGIYSSTPGEMIKLFGNVGYHTLSSKQFNHNLSESYGC